MGGLSQFRGGESCDRLEMDFIFFTSCTLWLGIWVIGDQNEDHVQFVIHRLIFFCVGFVASFD